jgi:hypothetical protein
LTVTRAEGLPAERLRAIFAPALVSLERCLPGKGGTLEVSVWRSAGALHVRVEPGASLDPTARRCAAAALSAVYYQETASAVGGPAVPPPGFSSLLTVSW